ncbi:hypothetical protein CERZMDRAFT_9577, partial [Cercospora zeae-maydis SCOH1-5]
LQQMQMSLGQKVQKKCLTCGMEYVASSAEDRKLHDKYHKQNVDGYDIGKDFVAKARQVGKRLCVFKGVKEGDVIVAVDSTNSVHRKRKAQAVLEVVQRELGAVEIPEKQIWEDKNRLSEGELQDPVYKSYLYIRGAKCVGFLLAKKIETAFEVQQEADAVKAIQQEIEEAAEHSVELSTTKHPAVMGVSRIWTSSSVRGQGIARCLLNTAINRHNSVVRKQDVAFSQPTAAGAQLARKWFGRAYGWRVYVD